MPVFVQRVRSNALCLGGSGWQMALELDVYNTMTQGNGFLLLGVTLFRLWAIHQPMHFHSYEHKTRCITNFSVQPDLLNSLVSLQTARRWSFVLLSWRLFDLCDSKDRHT